MTSLETAALAAYGAFSLSAADRLGEMPPWEAIPPEARADWRAVADAVQMIDAPDAAAAERARLFVAIRHGIPLDKPWRGEALDLISKILADSGVSVPGHPDPGRPA